MNMTWKITSEGVPPSAYQTTFAGIEPVEPDANKGYGAGLRWKWNIVDGPFAGRTISRVTGQTPTPNNACGRLIVALLGRTPNVGENIDLAPLIGKKYLAIVAAGQQGGTRVETVAVQQ